MSSFSLPFNCIIKVGSLSIDVLSKQRIQKKTQQQCESTHEKAEGENIKQKTGSELNFK